MLLTVVLDDSKHSATFIASVSLFMNRIPRNDSELDSDSLRSRYLIDANLSCSVHSKTE